MNSIEKSFQKYRDKIIRKFKAQEQAFRSHFASYLAVNGGLFVLWLFISPSFPWFFFPLGGWGIGLASTYFNMKSRKIESQELQSIHNLTEDQLQELTQFHKKRRRFINRLVDSIAVSAFLIGINIIIPTIPWSIIPASVLLVGAITKLPEYRSMESEVIHKFAQGGISIKKLGIYKLASIRSPDQIQSNPLWIEIENLQSSILSTVSEFDGQRFWGNNFEDTLRDYVKQVETLANNDSKIQTMLSRISKDNLDREYLKLESQKEQSSNSELKQEIDKSLGLIERQRSKYKDLKDHQQLLKARLTSALNTLRQLQLNVIHIQQSLEVEDFSPMTNLIEQSTEIQKFLSDYESEFRDLD